MVVDLLVDWIGSVVAGVAAVVAFEAPASPSMSASVAAVPSYLLASLSSAEPESASAAPVPVSLSR